MSDKIMLIEIINSVKKRLPLIVVITLIISVTVSAIGVYSDKQEEIYKCSGNYMIDYNKFLAEYDLPKINVSKKDILEKKKITDIFGISIYSELISDLIHSDIFYDKVIKSSGVDITKKQFDAVLMESIRSDGLSVKIDIYSNDAEQCMVISKSIDENIVTFFDEYLNFEVIKLALDDEATMIDSLPASTIERITSEIGHKYIERNMKDCLILFAKNFVMSVIAVFLFMLVLFGLISELKERREK